MDELDLIIDNHHLEQGLIKMNKDIKIVISGLNCFEDDHLQCADFKLEIHTNNNTKHYHFGECHLWWYDTLGFLEYHTESDTAQKNLVSALGHSFMVAAESAVDNQEKSLFNLAHFNYKMLKEVFEKEDGYEEIFQDIAFPCYESYPVVTI